MELRMTAMRTSDPLETLVQAFVWHQVISYTIWLHEYVTLGTFPPQVALRSWAKDRRNCSSFQKGQAHQSWRLCKVSPIPELLKRTRSWLWTHDITCVHTLTQGQPWCSIWGQIWGCPQNFTLCNGSTSGAGGVWDSLKSILNCRLCSRPWLSHNFSQAASLKDFTFA